MKEITYPGVAGKIQVNDDGEFIRYNGSSVTQTLVKGKHSRRGHYQLTIDGVIIYRSKLVALAYVPNPNNYTKVLHLNCNTTFDYYKNIVWGTLAMLIQNRQVQGIQGGGGKEFRGASKITYTEALKIVERLSSGESARAIAKEYNVSEMSIYRIKKRYYSEVAEK